LNLNLSSIHQIFAIVIMSSIMDEENQEKLEEQVIAEEEPQPGEPTELQQQDEGQPPAAEELKDETLETTDQGGAFTGLPDEGEEKAPEEIKLQEDGVTQQESAGKAAEEELGEPILDPSEHDVLNGRGASVNAHRGNTKFRALCFARKPEFEAGNHAAKRRVATEIVSVTKALPGRFLKRKQDKGPWFELSTEKSILKACQVMRDFQRPDRLALREMTTANGGRKRQRTSESTPGVNAVGFIGTSCSAPATPRLRFNFHSHNFHSVALPGKSKYSPFHQHPLRQSSRIHTEFTTTTSFPVAVPL
jgi:hypothetical protein